MAMVPPQLLDIPWITSPQGQTGLRPEVPSPNGGLELLDAMGDASEKDDKRERENMNSQDITELNILVLVFKNY